LARVHRQVPNLQFSIGRIELGEMSVVLEPQHCNDC